MENPKRANWISITLKMDPETQWPSERPLKRDDKQKIRNSGTNPSGITSSADTRTDG